MIIDSMCESVGNQWHCATSWKVAVSIPDGAVGRIV